MTDVADQIASAIRRMSTRPSPHRIHRGPERRLRRRCATVRLLDTAEPYPKRRERPEGLRSAHPVARVTV